MNAHLKKLLKTIWKQLKNTSVLLAIAIITVGALIPIPYLQTICQCIIASILTIIVVLIILLLFFSNLKIGKSMAIFLGLATCIIVLAVIWHFVGNSDLRLLIDAMRKTDPQQVKTNSATVTVGKQKTFYPFDSNGEVTVYISSDATWYPVGGKIKVQTPMKRTWIIKPGDKFTLPVEPPGNFTFSKNEKVATGIDVWQ